MEMNGCKGEPGALAFFACVVGDHDLLRFCFDHGIEPDVTMDMDGASMSLLLFSALIGDVELVSAFGAAARGGGGGELPAPSTGTRCSTCHPVCFCT